MKTRRNRNVLDQILSARQSNSTETLDRNGKEEYMKINLELGPNIKNGMGTRFPAVQSIDNDSEQNGSDSK